MLVRRIIPLVLLLSTSLADGQLKLVDFAYSPFNKGPPNAGYMQVYVTGSSTGFPGETSWYSVCASSPQGSRALVYAFCVKYGYFSGIVHEIVQSNTQTPCANVACAGERANLADCSINLDRQWTAKKILHVICYQINSSPLGQSYPSQSFRSSVNCDFETGGACGWDQNGMRVLNNGLYYKYDATLGTTDGHVIAPSCPNSWIPWSGQPSVSTMSAITSPWVDQCLGYKKYCFTFSSFVPLSTSRQTALNISVLDWGGRQIWTTQWSPIGKELWWVSQIGFTASTPFRLRIGTSCLDDGQPPSIFLDDFLLTTGECLSAGRQCYNNGIEKTSNNGDKYCECQNGWTMGKRCELTACARAGILRAGFLKAILIAFVLSF